MNHLPIECVNRIMNWYWEFQRPVAIMRITNFQKTYASVWSDVMTEIRERTPEYSLVWNNVDYPSPMTLFYPDCNPRLPGMTPSAYTVQRRVGIKSTHLSLETY